MDAICTIITSDYLHYALALNESLLQYQKVKFYILVVDQKVDESSISNLFPNIKFLYLNDIKTTEIANKIIKKYQTVNKDALRWSLKSVLLIHLLQIHNRVIYLDCDLYFFNDYKFLFQELEENDLIITPHWRSSNPYLPNHNFELLFTGGLFNAGFIGANKRAKMILSWWAMCCEYKCEININQGHYVDQTYLNLIPIYFDKVKILKHKGCNISEWNYDECKRTKMTDGVIFINQKYPIIFIHFIKSLIENIKKGEDVLLSEHLNAFETSLNNYKVFSDPYEMKKSIMLENYTNNPKEKSVLMKFKQKLRIKTRLKRFLQG